MHTTMCWWVFGVSKQCACNTINIVALGQRPHGAIYTGPWSTERFYPMAPTATSMQSTTHFLSFCYVQGFLAMRDGRSWIAQTAKSSALILLYVFANFGISLMICWSAPPDFGVGAHADTQNIVVGRAYSLLCVQPAQPAHRHPGITKRTIA